MVKVIDKGLAGPDSVHFSQKYYLFSPSGSMQSTESSAEGDSGGASAETNTPRSPKRSKRKPKAGQ